MAKKKVTPNEIEVVFNTPCVINGESVEKVTLKKPKVRDHLAAEKMVGVDGSDFQKEVYLLASCAGCSPAEIHDLYIDDYTSLREGYQSFF